MDTPPLEETRGSLPLTVHSAVGELVRPDTVRETSHLREYSEPAVGDPLSVMVRFSTLGGTVGGGGLGGDHSVWGEGVITQWIPM